MKIARILCECPKHGQTPHGVYKYGNSTSTRCLLCAKEQRAARSKDPAKKAHDLAYTKKWIGQNKEHYDAVQKSIAKRNRDKLDLDVKIFLEEEKAKIVNLLLRIDSNLSLEDVEKHCLHFNITSFDTVKDFIFTNKRSKLYNAESWKQSTLSKYHYGIQELYGFLPERTKRKIREEYKTKAKEIVNKKIEELCKTI
jgi:hypothetical protein